ncbi:MAG: hypothetical protein BKP49_01970 [Treponema sp. CETP13]|nr:MAG: hypothetical protein BKP49_01970 [Treponema sp. CETP13]
MNYLNTYYGVLEQSGADVETTIAEALEKTLNVEQMEAETMDVSGYVEELVGESGLSAIMNYAGSIQDRGANSRLAVEQNYTLNADTVKQLATVSAVMMGIENDLEVAAAKLAAEQAQQVLEETQAQYIERLNAENEGMRDWEIEMVRNSGYSADGGSIYRNAVIDATISGAIRKRQTVHMYEDFETNDPENSIENTTTEGLSSRQILLAVKQAINKLSEWGERIFGETEEDGSTKSQNIPRDLSAATKLTEYAQSDTDTADLEKLQALQDKDYDKLTEAEKEKYTELTNKYVSVRDGELGEHIGYAPIFKSGESLDLSASRSKNVKSYGRGEMGSIMLDFQWNSMLNNQGYTELAKPVYDKKMWDDDGSLIEPPTIRGVTDIAVTVALTVVGTIAAPGIGTTIALAVGGLADDALFAGLDLTGGYKTAEEVGNVLGKKALTTALTAGVGGAASSSALTGAVSTLSGAGKIAANMGIAGASAAANTVGSSAINCMDLSRIGQSGFFDTNSFSDSMSSASTWGSVASSMAGAGITSGLGELNLRDGNNILLNKQTFDTAGIQSFNSFAGSMGSTYEVFLNYW